MLDEPQDHLHTFFSNVRDGVAPILGLPRFRGGMKESGNGRQVLEGHR